MIYLSEGYFERFLPFIGADLTEFFINSELQFLEAIYSSTTY